MVFVSFSLSFILLEIGFRDQLLKCLERSRAREVIVIEMSY